MMTAERGTAVVKQAVALGITDYVVKPLTVRTRERLVRVLHSVCSVDDQEDADNGQVPLDEHLTGPVVEGNPNSVLVAEGDSDYRDFLMDFFKTRCAALQASSGADALTLCLRAAPQLVFVGGELGIIDAATLVRKIRATSGLTNMRVIATVPTSQIADTRQSGLYHSVIGRSFVPNVFGD